MCESVSQIRNRCLLTKNEVPQKGGRKAALSKVISSLKLISKYSYDPHLKLRGYIKITWAIFFQINSLGANPSLF